MSHSEQLARFQAAIKASDVSAALAAARGMEMMGLADSLALCRVLAQARDPLYDRAARRWIVALAGEADRSLGDVAIGATALETLAVEPESARAVDALAGLVRYQPTAKP